MSLRFRLRFFVPLATCGAVAVCGGALPTTAQATCYSSTPSSAVFTDSASDGTGGLAPELTTIQASLNGACAYSVSPGLVSPVLIDGESVFVYINTDGNPSTGEPVFQGADVAVGVLGKAGADSLPLLGTWNGTDISFSDPNPLGAVGLAGFSASVDRLGIATGVATPIRVGSLYKGIYSNYSDFAPDAGQAPFPLNVSYSTTPPPTPGPAPVSTPAPGSPQTTGTAQPTSSMCEVPYVRGLTFNSAIDRFNNTDNCTLRTADRYVYNSVVRKGRIVRTIPAAGARTRHAVQLVVSRGKRPKRRARRATASQLRTLNLQAQVMTLNQAMSQATRAGGR